MKTLSKKQVLMLHAQVIRETGGAEGLRDENLLDSALASPFHTFEDQDLYPTIQKNC